MSDLGRNLLKQQLIDSIAEGQMAKVASEMQRYQEQVSPARSDAGESGGASVTANSRDQQTGAPPHHKENSMFDWNEKAPLLNAKLDPKHVTQREMAGKKIDYIEGWWDIAEANRIFGFGEWSFEIDALELLSKELVDSYGKKQWRVCYSCTATVIVGGVRRQDVGYGQGQAKPEDVGAALESAGKEAATDALKRCLRTFGNPFGLALYDKSRANVGVDAPATGFRMDPDGYPEPPHDPETGEVRNNPALAASEGLHDAFTDSIKDSMPFDCSDMSKLHPAQRLRYWAAAADLLITAINVKKSAAGASAQWDKRDALIMEMQEAAPVHYHRVLDAFNDKMRTFEPPADEFMRG